jgi:pimeloyl-ACP methyl ester carboxylesterase
MGGGMGDMLGGMGGGMGDMLGGLGGGEMGGGMGDMLGGLGGGSEQASEGGGTPGGSGGASEQASEGGGAESGKKPVVIISHGMGASGGSMSAMAQQFEAAGYHVETPTDTGSPFDGSGAVDAYNRLEAQGNPELDLNNVVLVGHSAGGSAAQQASQELGDNVAGVITIDGAQSMGGTNTNVPHANFSHSGDMFGPMVGNPNPSVPANLQSDQELPGSHMTAMTGSDADNYVNAANRMVGR